ncbi:peptidase domain-containing ABC transporter [Grimontia sp. S25]|uniref:Peptidase domain-containing ABC transporter n=1 Tax=Grimontia sedimenti TaxID=2711294 RepID=A0A6M1R9I6_9GAMM|nr:peptidase domain-containing ABC transporter [Grimontia sedimenti]NGN96786.1 peptidase domain-containing ABC transporter [Grimontia sedimenti]
MQVVDQEPHITSLIEYSGKKSVKPILQTESAECGLACLAMVSSYHGHKLDMPSVRKRFSAGLSGMTVHHLIQAADKLNLAARAIKCPLESVGKLSLPCILHWDLNHFVVLTGVKKNQLFINDPATGPKVLSVASFSEKYTGIAVELMPTSDFKKADERQKMSLTQLWTKISGFTGALTSLIVLSILLQIFVLANPYYIQLVLDEVIVRYDDVLLIVLALGFSLVLLFSTVTTAIRSWLILRLSSQLNLQMGANLLRHLLRLPMSFFETRHVGDIVSRFGSLADIRERMTTGLVETVVDGVMSTTVLIVMLIYSPTLTAVVMAVVLLYLALRLVMFRRLKQVTEASIEAKAKEQSQFLETVRGMQTVRLFNAESTRQSHWQNLYGSVINSDIRLGRLNIGFEAARQFLFGLEHIIVIYLAATGVMSGSLTVGMVFAFLAYKAQLTTRFTALIEQLILFKMMRLHLDRIADIAMHEQEAHRDNGREIERLGGEIELVNVSFRYSEQSDYLLNNINLRIAPGECVAIVGPSGCGKSTLIKIMLGLLQPTSGQVRVGGEDIRDIGLVNYRKLIASVMQDDVLLSGSIEDNIAFFSPEPNQELIYQCAYFADIHQDITRLPMGYQSLIADMGSNLSGGQMQRLLLARALYRQPAILYLDEATSSLDVERERNVTRNITSLPLTRVMIAHRPETIKSADRVIDMAAL